MPRTNHSRTRRRSVTTNNAAQRAAQNLVGPAPYRNVAIRRPSVDLCLQQDGGIEERAECVSAASGRDHREATTARQCHGLIPATSITTMALAPCPECGHQVSTAAKTCPNCGFPISNAGTSQPASTPATPTETPAKPTTRTCATPGCERLRVDETSFCPAHQPGSTSSSGLSVGAWVGIVVIAMIGLGWFLASNSGSSGSFSGRVISYQVVNPASLQVSLRVTNTGDTAGNWQCTVEANDSSGAYHGFDILSSTSPLTAGSSDVYRGTLIITSEGAPFVNSVTVRDCKPD